MLKMLPRSVSNSSEARPSAVRLLAALSAACAIVVLAASILTAPINHDEHMYLAAAELVFEAVIYEDFAYFQTPYMPYFYRLASEMSDSPARLLTARTTKILLATAILVVCFLLFRLSSRDGGFAFALVGVLFCNDIFRYTAGFARNYDGAMLFLLLAALYITWREPKSPGAPTYIVTGALLGLAIGTKLTFALTPLAFLLPILLRSGISTKSLKLASWLVLGVGIGLLPAAWVALKAGLSAAHFNNVEYHAITTAWRRETGFHATMTLADKLRNAKHQLSTVPNQLLAVVWLFSLASVAFRPKCRLETHRSWAFVGSALLVSIGVLLVLLPTPVWRSYFAPLVIFVCLNVASLYRVMQPSVRTSSKQVAFVALALLFAFHLPTDVRTLAASSDPATWTGVRTHEAGERLASAIDSRHVDRPVATISPLFVLEAGLEIYPELASGPFGYRVGRMIPETRRSALRITSTECVGELLRRSPPSAVLVDMNDELDDPLERFARNEGYRPLWGPVHGYRLYVRP